MLAGEFCRSTVVGASVVKEIQSCRGSQLALGKGTLQRKSVEDSDRLMNTKVVLHRQETANSNKATIGKKSDVSLVTTC